mmetsp:Transcript_6187/g.12137  ORF Transcript_6187/g.12137 Transcript_6187/m.12137 type:complete len:156 (+) Transcript_6187:2591-3058(+)
MEEEELMKRNPRKFPVIQPSPELRDLLQQAIVRDLEVERARRTAARAEVARRMARAAELHARVAIDRSSARPAKLRVPIQVAETDSTMSTVQVSKEGSEVARNSSSEEIRQRLAALRARRDALQMQVLQLSKAESLPMKPAEAVGSETNNPDKSC